jgi:SAM-dependent methyltransferase
MKHSADWYQYPAYFDLAFRDETAEEIKFLQGAFAKYVPFPVKRVLEPACGTGRLLLPLSRLKYEVVGFDLSPAMLAYAQRRFARAKLSADLFLGDMANFSLNQFQRSQPVDAAFNTFNSFRHLLTEEAAVNHLQCVAKALKPGGIYVLGLHLLPPDASEESCERWTAKQGTTRLTATLKVIAANRRRRLETLRINMLVRSAKQEHRICSEFTLRIYQARQLQALVAKVPAFQLRDVFDFWYELDHPLQLTNALSDTVLILQKG